MKKLYIYILSFFLVIRYSYGAGADDANFLFIDKQEELLPTDNYFAGEVVEKVGGALVSNMIIYVAFFAVIALVISGFMFMIAGGEEEKVKKAKTWVIWSLVGVFLSISAYGIIDFVLKLNITLP